MRKSGEEERGKRDSSLSFCLLRDEVFALGRELRVLCEQLGDVLAMIANVVTRVTELLLFVLRAGHERRVATDHLAMRDEKMEKIFSL